MKSTRKAALAAGDFHYYTGRYCKYGHLSKRQTTSGNCVECLKTIHYEKKLKHNSTPEKIERSKFYHKFINDKKRKNAVNYMCRWLTKDIEKVLAKKDGSYVLSASVAADLLGRSYRSIENVRNHHNRYNR